MVFVKFLTVVDFLGTVVDFFWIKTKFGFFLYKTRKIEINELIPAPRAIKTPGLYIK